jgi:nucleoside-diphosphate-sugar epimerase
VFLGDVKDEETVIEAVGYHDGVIHLAGVLGTQETLRNPRSAIEVNILGSLNVFDACRLHKKKAVYIAVGNYWMNNPYSITKTTAERFALMYNREFGTQIAVVRGLNAYGPRQKPKPVRKVVPTFVLSALRGEDIVIYGSGNQIMDMIYVTDIAEILVRALLYDHGVYSSVFEAGMGRDTTVNELAKLIVEISGSKSRVAHVEMRPGEVPDSVVKADTTSLRCLGYPPQDFVSLTEGLGKTIDWYREYVRTLG